MPDFELENIYDGPVFGIDEAGRGPLAGPVVAACVHIPKSAYSLPFLSNIQDSKLLTLEKREALYAEITSHCQWAVIEVSPQNIDRLNIHHATLLAMQKSCLRMAKPALMALIDGKFTPELPCPARAVVGGDGKSLSIAAASIVAKVTRDRIMSTLHKDHGHYSWHTNVGYGTKVHKDAIDQYGITPHHRKSFAPVKNFLAYGTTRQPLQTAG